MTVVNNHAASAKQIWAKKKDKPDFGNGKHHSDVDFDLNDSAKKFSKLMKSSKPASDQEKIKEEALDEKGNLAKGILSDEDDKKPKDNLLQMQLQKQKQRQDQSNVKEELTGTETSGRVNSLLVGEITLNPSNVGETTYVSGASNKVDSIRAIQELSSKISQEINVIKDANSPTGSKVAISFKNDILPETQVTISKSNGAIIVDFVSNSQSSMAIIAQHQGELFRKLRNDSKLGSNEVVIRMRDSNGFEVFDSRNENSENLG